MTEDDCTILRACVQTGLVCLAIVVILAIVEVVREWWRNKNG